MGVNADLFIFWISAGVGGVGATRLWAHVGVSEKHFWGGWCQPGSLTLAFPSIT